MVIFLIALLWATSAFAQIPWWGGSGTGGVGGGLSSVTGTAGQITAVQSGTNATISLPATITQATTFSGGVTTSSATITGGSITGLATCTNPGDVCSKSYIDATQQNGNPHAPVAWSTAAVLPNTPTYNNGAGTLTDSSTGSVLVIDGQNVTVVGTRVLVQTQAAGAQNGIYTLSTAGVSGTTKWVLTRAADFNTVAVGNIATGANTWACASCYGLTAGATNDGKTFAMNTTGTIVLGTTALVWVQINNSTTYTANNGITLTSSVFGLTPIAATSVLANTTGGSAVPSSALGYGTGVNQLLQLNGSGLVPAANLPNPSASTLGGVESLAPSASMWINAISTLGVPSATRPAFTDISGAATFAQLPAVTGPIIVGRVTNTNGATSAAYTPSNGTDTTVALTHSTFTSGHCMQANDTTGTLVDSGAACGSVNFTASDYTGTSPTTLPSVNGRETTIAQVTPTNLTINLPSTGLVTNFVACVKDRTNDFAKFPAKVTTTDSSTIDGFASVLMQGHLEELCFIYLGGGVWISE